MATATPAQTATLQARLPGDWSLEDLRLHLGCIPLDRIRLFPPPGYATEKDVIEIEAREDRLYELENGILVEKAMGWYESLLASIIITRNSVFLETHDLGKVLGEAGRLKILPGIVKIPDVSFIGWDRWPKTKLPRRPIPALVPDLAVEVLSEANTSAEKDEIGLKVGRVLNKYKVGKHFRLTIDDSLLKWERKQQTIEQEAELDGIYVIRTSESPEKLSAENVVRSYKRLADVEQAFRSLKGLELMVRPIHHRLENRVRAHLFICLLAYYVQWHLKRAWSPLLFADEQLEKHRADRDPVASAKPAPDVQAKKVERKTKRGNELQSFRTMLKELATQCQNTCDFGEGISANQIVKLAEFTPFQEEAFGLLEEYCSQ
jgi:Uma2 family endonuclease